MHRIGLATHDAYVHAWVLDLPGCIVGGHDLDAVALKLPVTIAEHLAWLRSHGELVEASDDWEVTETIHARTAAGGDPCFAAERAWLSAAALATLIARLAYARADLMSAVEPLPDAVLDWMPPAAAFEKFDPWAPDVRTIRALLRHVLQFEVYYRDGLRDGAAKGIYEDTGDPTAEHARTVDMLLSLTDDDRSLLFRPLRPGQSAPEEWTERKMLRRSISHERAHAAEIQQRRTWLLLGVPGAEDA